MKISAIIAAAGSGSRCNLGYNKLLYKINGKTILEYTLGKFIDVERIDEIILSVSNNDYMEVKKLVESIMTNVTIKVARGGSTRALSIKNCLAIIDDATELVIIHDGARPYISTNDIEAVIDKAMQEGGALLAKPMTETIKQLDNGKLVNVKREEFIIATTPQAYNRALIEKAYQSVDYRSVFTDDSEVYLANTQGSIAVVEESSLNTKITSSNDIIEFEEYINKKHTTSNFGGSLYGIGYDVHRLVEGRKLVLGGVEIPHNKGLLGHSDADCLLHAIMDAILSAIGKRDIGYHFPDSDDMYKGIDSTVLYDRVMELMDKEGYKLFNISATIIAQEPKMSPHIDQIREKIAQLSKIFVKRVAIHATTTEKLGTIGMGEGIAVQAICSVIKK